MERRDSFGEWRQAIVSAVAGVVGMIPEGLVLLTSLNFAVAAMRLARKNTLVQELESVETLARVDCLNLDKTGTITDGGIMFDRLVMLERMDGDDRVESAATQALYDLSNEEQPNGTGQAVLDGLGNAVTMPARCGARAVLVGPQMERHRHPGRSRGNGIGRRPRAADRLVYGRTGSDALRAFRRARRCARSGQ